MINGRWDYIDVAVAWNGASLIEKVGLVIYEIVYLIGVAISVLIALGMAAVLILSAVALASSLF